MQTKHLCVLIHIWTKGEVGAPWHRFKPSCKIYLLTVPRRCFICGSFMLFLSCFCYAFVCVCLLSPDGKGLTSWFWFVISNCEVVTFPLVSWVRRRTWLHRFLIFALFLTWTSSTDLQWQVLELRIVEIISSIKTCTGIHSISSTSSDRYWSSG